MSDRAARLQALRESVRRERVDRDLAQEIGTVDDAVAVATTARCPHGRGPARACSQCLGARVVRSVEGASGGNPRRRGVVARLPAGALTRTAVETTMGIPRPELKGAIESGQLRARRTGTFIWFARADVERWLEARGRSASPSVADDQLRQTRPEKRASATPVSVDDGAHGDPREAGTGPAAPLETRAVVGTFPEGVA